MVIRSVTTSEKAQVAGAVSGSGWVPRRRGRRLSRRGCPCRSRAGASRGGRWRGRRRGLRAGRRPGAGSWPVVPPGIYGYVVTVSHAVTTLRGAAGAAEGFPCALRCRRALASGCSLGCGDGRLVRGLCGHRFPGGCAGLSGIRDRTRQPAGADWANAAPWPPAPEPTRGPPWPWAPGARDPGRCRCDDLPLGPGDIRQPRAGIPVRRHTGGGLRDRDLPALLDGTAAGVLIPPAAGPGGLWRAARDLLADPVRYRQACRAAYCRSRNCLPADIADTFLKAVW